MRKKSEKCLRLTLVVGALLVALFYFWSPGSIEEVDIRPRQDTPIKYFFTIKTGDATDSYEDIPYHVKEEITRCVFLKCDCFLFKFMFFSSSSHSVLFPTVVWLTMLAYASPMREPFTCRCPICSSHKCQLKILLKHS